jgi:hypothetical protein
MAAHQERILMQSLPYRARRLRIAQGLTQAELAASLPNVSAADIRRYEWGKETMPVRLWDPLAAVYGVSIDHLIGWDR